GCDVGGIGFRCGGTGGGGGRVFRDAAACRSGDGRRHVVPVADRDGDGGGCVVDAVIGMDGDLVGIVAVEVGGAREVGGGEEADLDGERTDVESAGQVAG